MPRSNKSKQQKKKNVVVEVRRPARKAKVVQVIRQVSKANSRRFRTARAAPSKAQFALALRDPFSPDALGVQVPDPYAFPTSPYHLHGEVQLTAVSGVAVFNPNPLQSMYTNASGNVVTTGMTATASNANIFKATTIANMGSICDTWRTVAWGIKISNNQAPLSATGRIVVFFIPATSQQMGYNLLENVALSASPYTVTTYGQIQTVLNSSATLQFPTAIEFSVSDLMEGEVEVSGLIYNSSFYVFRNGTDSNTASATNNFGGLVDYTASTGVINQSDDPSITSMSGAAAIGVYWEGMSSSSLANLNIEYIYHVETTPTLSATSGATPVPSNPRISKIGTTFEVETAMATQTPMSAVNFLSKGEKFLDRVSSTTVAGGKALSNMYSLGRMVNSMVSAARPALMAV
jgi:hypothetical protein